MFEDSKINPCKSIWCKVLFWDIKLFILVEIQKNSDNILIVHNASVV